MDLKFYLGVFLRRWWIIVLMTGLVAGFSYYRISQLPTTWTASARLLYEPNNVANSVLGSTGISFPMSWTNPVTTQLQLVKTRPNVEEVVKRLDLKDGTGKLMDPGRIMGGLSASVSSESDIIVIGYRSHSPDHAIEIVNEVGKVFVERNKSYQQETARSTREFIEEQLTRTQKMLHEAESKLRIFREQEKIYNMSSYGGQTAGQLSEIDGDLIALEIDKKVAEERLADARRHVEITDPTLLMRMEKLELDPIYQQLKGRLGGLEGELRLARLKYTDDAPEIRDLESNLTKIKAAVQVRVRYVLGRGLDEDAILIGRTPTEERYMGKLIEAQSELAAINAREKALGLRKGIFEERFLSLPEKEQRYAELVREQQAAEAAYSVFYKRMHEMRITEAMSLGTVRMIEEARHVVPHRQSFEKGFGLACLMGFVFGLGIALLVEFLDDRIRRPEEAENALELPILGLLPWVEGRQAAKRRLVVLEDPRSPVTESYRALQTYTRMVQADADQPQAFLITSPGPKEGKSTVAANLAITSAQLGKRTILVDTDLRAPCQHINFDLQNLVGIYDVVYENLPLDEAIQRTEIEHLDVLSTGPVPPDPVQTLHADRFKKLVERLRQDYDVIFFDSPPINLFTDAAVLGRQVDSVLLVVDVRSTTRQSTIQAKELLTKARLPLSGMIVKNTAHRASKYHNRYYERYYMDRLKNLADD